MNIITNSSKNRPCPACDSNSYQNFADEKIDLKRINQFTYSSRKEPELMCLQLVRCNFCNLVYTPNPPDNSFLSIAYADASYDSGFEAECAAESYAKALAPYVKNLKNKNGAVDVGAGSGALLPWLSDFGFQRVVGIEPSRAAIDSAKEPVRSMLLEGMFVPELIKDFNPSLICSFMTLEHMDDPGFFMTNSFNLIEPGGMIAIVVHNWQGLLNRFLGLRSPIIDVEHLQLFNPNSINTLLRRAGFESIKIKSIVNNYPLKYWLRLMPLSSKFKGSISSFLEKLSLSTMRVSVPVGNILAVGRKPE